MQDSSTAEACSICLDRLAGRQLGVCLGSDGCRVCSHYFHLHCLRKVEGAHCPQCRARFTLRAILPNVQKSFDEWCRTVSLRGRSELSLRELLAALTAMVPLAASSVTEAVQKSLAELGSTDAVSLSVIGAESLRKVAADLKQFLPDEDAFEFNNDSAQVKMTENDVAKHESQDGHSGPGIVCRCGQIHIRRGDRIRRGPQELDIDCREIPMGSLGTIARVGPRQESVIVKWDRTPLDKVHAYTWPDPDGRVLLPVTFREISKDTESVQNLTGLSSIAAEELLNRVGFCKGYNEPNEVNEALEVFGRESRNISEENLRRNPKLFHQIRILPDAVLVQKWFDAIPPCKCSNARCRGGVHWSAEADKHLGREGILLKIDKDDDTVLIETVGPCTCRVWFPRLAVEPIYNIDLAELPMFEVAARVECRMEEGWSMGIVEQVLWNGADRQGPCPYTVKLDDGRSIFVPNVNLIRKARETN